MQRPTIPSDEEARLSLLKACNIMHTPDEEAFDDMARLAADLCETEIALVTLVDAEHQWFKARVGIDRTEVPRDLSFCGHCINHRNALIVEDTELDPRFADNPLVTGDPFIRFYAGLPLLIDEGSSIGALSVAARAPRKLSAKQLQGLERIAKQIARELRLRRDLSRSQPAAPLTPPTTLAAEGAVIGGRWRLVREIGRGATGTVFEGRDAREEERVAVKILHPAWAASEEVLERFAREARVLMRLKSPHVGRLLDVGNLDPSQGRLPYLALEYLEGMDLDAVLAARGRIPYREAFAWCADACEGVAEAHELGVVHRDLKPSNVFLSGAASRRVVKVLDFGIATRDPGSVSPSRITAVSSAVGSPAYMSPEQMMSPRDVDARSDVWSMGAMLYELVSGNHPFRGGSELELFANVMTKPPLPLRAHTRGEVPPEAEAVLMKCLRRSRDERYATMGALADALRAAAA